MITTHRYKLLRSLLVAYREMFSFADVRSRALNATLACAFVFPTIIVVLGLWGLDRRIHRHGLVGAMDWVLHRFYGGARSVRGDLPRHGAALFVGNHPGLGDLPALVSLAGRDDLYVVAKQRELTRDMRGILEHCIVIDETLSSRARAVKQVIAQLRAGAVVVIYPAGAIEPDPVLTECDRDFLSTWSPVVEGLVQRIRRAGLTVPVFPIYTQGVHHVPSVLRGLLRKGPSRKAREGRAALMTLVSKTARRRSVLVAVGEAIVAGAVTTAGEPTPVTPASTASHSLTEAIRASLRYSAAEILRSPGPRLPSHVVPYSQAADHVHRESAVQPEPSHA